MYNISYHMLHSFLSLSPLSPPTFPFSVPPSLLIPPFLLSLPLPWPTPSLFPSSSLSPLSFLHSLTPPPFSLPSWMTDDQLDTLAPTLTNGYPNTYTYTKALAEQVSESSIIRTHLNSNYGHLHGWNTLFNPSQILKCVNHPHKDHNP